MQQETIDKLLHHSGAPPFTGDQKSSFIMRLLNGHNADPEFDQVFEVLDDVNQAMNGNDGRSESVKLQLVYGVNEMISTLLFDQFTKLGPKEVEKCRNMGRLVLHAWEAIVQGDCGDLRVYAQERSSR